MKKVLFAVMLMLGMGSASAAPAVAPIVGAVYGFGLIVMNDEPIQACYNEPARLVKWKGQPGYSFTLAGCDYIAKQDLVVVVK